MSLDLLIDDIADQDPSKTRDAEKALKFKSREHQYYYLWDVDMGNTRSPGENAQYYFLNSPYLNDSKQKVEAMIELFTQSQEIVEGVYKCSNCQSKKTLSLSKQVRSADENTSNQIICANCGNTWNEN